MARTVKSGLFGVLLFRLRSILTPGATRRFVFAWCGVWAGVVSAAGEGASTAQPQHWRWKPRDRTIRVHQERTSGPDGREIEAWHVVGTIETGWNYVLTSARPLKAGKPYRLTVWLRVDRLGAQTPPPYFKCEFVAKQGKRPRSLGRAVTAPYDRTRLGTWQKVTGEFIVPDSAAAGWLALEKGTSGRASIDAWLYTARLESIPRLSVVDTYRCITPPRILLKWRGVHPRLFWDSSGLDALKARLKEPKTARMWKEVRALADRYARRGPPKYKKYDRHSGDEQLWQRGVGNAMPYLALAWRLTGDKRYLDAARSWALASCSYPTWGLGRRDGMDLAAGHQLLGLALVYDWCFNDLDDASRATIRRTLEKRASAMFMAAASGKAWWGRAYLQNHLWVNSCGLAAAGFALFDVNDEAVTWIGLPLAKFRKTMGALGPDGASHEGVGYWQYGVEYMMKFIELARTLLGEDLADGVAWWRRTAAYYEYLTLPRHAWTRRNSIVDIADCPRYNWYGPDYLLRGLARWFQDAHAQWFAFRVDEADIDAPGARWLNLLWFDRELPESPPDDLPTLHWFKDMGIVSARSDWSGDESLVVFKCGPFIGHHALHMFAYDPGGGHVHPDANHFVLFGCGEWLVRDDGYASKWTRQHNTLLVNGRGQIGEEGHAWFAGAAALAARAEPRVLAAETHDRWDRLVGEASAAYPAELGLERFRRTLFFIKPNVLLVCDDIAVRKTADMELRFHPESTVARHDGNAVMIEGKRARLRIELLTPEEVRIDVGNQPKVGRGGKSTPFFTIRFLRRARRWRNVTALSWSDRASQPAEVHVEVRGDRLFTRVNGNSWEFSWPSGE